VQLNEIVLQAIPFSMDDIVCDDEDKRAQYLIEFLVECFLKGLDH